MVRSGLAALVLQLLVLAQSGLVAPVLLLLPAVQSGLGVLVLLSLSVFLLSDLLLLFLLVCLSLSVRARSKDLPTEIAHLVA